MIAVYIAAGLVLLCILYLLSTMGRRKHPGMETLRGWSYAHRGLHDANRPENSMAAFRAALDAGYGIELDVHLLSDGTLAVIHDYSLERTTGLPGRIEDLTQAQLSQCFLGGTSQTIPTFAQVLELFDGKAPLIVELKVANNNYPQLAQAACALLDRYNGPFCIESFDPRCVRWLMKNRPDLIRGQLNQHYGKGEAPYPWILRFMMSNQMLNFLIRPDFVAYRYKDRRNLGNFVVRKIWGVQGVSWTLKTPEEYAAATKEGWLPIFEQFTP